MLWAPLCIFVSGSVQAQEKNERSYAEAGITVSSLVHPSIGYWWGRTGVRFSGIYYKEDHQEYHLNIGYRLYDSSTVQRSINLLTSRVVASDPGADYRYTATGIAYALNYKGFFVELGVAHAWRNEIGNLAHDPLIPCGYWGYIYRFWSR